MSEDSHYAHGTPLTVGNFRDGTLMTTQDLRRFVGVPTFLKAPLLGEVENPTVGIVGVPYDGGVIRTPGTRFGPRSVRNYCWRLNEFNAELGVNPYARHNIVDCGDLVLSPLSIDDTYEAIVKGMGKILAAGLVPIAVGGDHFITHPILHAMHAAKGKVAVIHFDAHTDTADEGFGQKLHHGTMFRRAIEEGLIDGDKLIQVGIRKLFSHDELDYHAEHGIEVITSREMKMMGPGLRAELQARFARFTSERVYVTYDIDFVDPAYAPGTGSPEVGGPTSDEALECVRALQGLEIVGFDLTEVAPEYDLRDITCLLSAQILYEMVSVLRPTVN